MLSEFNDYTGFIKNKYRTLYTKIIKKALCESRSYNSEQYESHHILPECFGGKICVNLTFREHYICHLLLTKFTLGSDKMKMCFALHTFFHFDKNRKLHLSQTSKLYENHKKMFIEFKKIQATQKNPNQKLEEFIFKNRKTSDVFVGNRKDFITYSKLTNQEVYNLITTKNNIRHSKNWGVFVPSEKCFSYEIPEKKRLSAPQKKCEYCNKIISSANYYRWHGANCKSINPKKHNENIEQIKKLNFRP
jgi:hypothetical protein